jgi:hypothetical protein
MIDFLQIDNYTAEELFSFGFKIYQDMGKHTLLLIPSSLYDDIPDGVEFVDTGKTFITFKNGVTSRDSRFNLLSFGVLRQLDKK